ncbi:winged helix-turn-helix transcriptional regulator [Rhizobium acidisoli]|uniref:winged helix-turn-helix transcriptional regulator n=1 Tax=Rhizobium acidisoli TaxID=1538158 RepID=UPI001FD9EABD|nr:helix-turn-helix domain-containing protein [Rhizobium acidisoli]
MNIASSPDVEKPLLMQRQSSVRRTMEIVFETWNFLILREAYFGVRRFDKFQERLGIPRQTLSSRLSSLVANEILSTGKRPNEPGQQYFLTLRGKDLFPTMLSLTEFGDKWLTGGNEAPLQLILKKLRLATDRARGMLRSRRARHLAEAQIRHFWKECGHAPSRGRSRSLAIVGASSF